jgi:hypothetical protein
MDIRTFTIGVGTDEKHTRRDLPYARNSADWLAKSKWAKWATGESATFIDTDASTVTVTERLTTLADKTEKGKIFVSFSGHGRAFGDETDGWQLTNDVLKGDDIVKLLCHFKAGVEVTVVSDCCYAGNLLDGLNEKKHAATILAISATGLTGLAFPEQTPARPEQAVSALVKALENVEPGTPPEEIQKVLRAELRGKIYQQVPVVKRYEARG